jgi:hypothetical protein
VIRGELEPSIALIDRCVHMADSNCLKYLPFELCTKRDMEMRGIEKDPEWAQSPDPFTGLMKFKLMDHASRSPVDSQFGLIFALQRRGLALDMADLLSFENHEILRGKFIAALMKTPFSGFARFTVEQVVEADIEFFKLLSEHCRDGIRRQGAVTRPFDRVFAEVLKHEDFTQAMQPRLAPPQGVQRQQNLAAAVAQAFSTPGAAPTLSQSAEKNARKRATAQVQQNLKPKPSPPPPTVGGKGSGGKGESFWPKASRRSLRDVPTFQSGYEL